MSSDFVPDFQTILSQSPALGLAYSRYSTFVAQVNTENTVKSRQGLGPIQMGLLFCGDISKDEEKGISQTYLGYSPDV